MVQASESELGAGNPPRPELLMSQIRFLAAESSQVIITHHAEERMDERGITSKVMFDVLKKGMISGPIRSGKKPSDWVVKLTLQMPTRRQVGVVTVVQQGDKLIIVTVEWEDWK
ncbi:DUF4258 domain-containing protein [Thioclava sp. GXIMD4215]|uniref:DUF4258 domain-containing protein n=1 Tax=Thioclava sp. GXIMD4215 TaxID=3131928 RepID=UPI00325101CA